MLCQWSIFDKLAANDFKEQRTKGPYMQENNEVLTRLYHSQAPSPLPPPGIEVDVKASFHKQHAQTQ